MTAVVSDQRRQRMSINPDQPASGVARQPQIASRSQWHHRQMRADECDGERFIGDMPSNLRNFAWFLRREPERSQIFTPHFTTIRHPSVAHAAKVLWTSRVQHGYRFHNASMTESCCVEWDHCRCLAAGLGGRNQIEVCDVASEFAAGAPRRCRPLHRLARRDHDAGQLGVRRRHPRRTQTADALQMGRMPARLQRVGFGRRHRHC